MQGNFISSSTAGEEPDLVWHLPLIPQVENMVADIIETEVSVTLCRYIVAFVK